MYMPSLRVDILSLSQQEASVGGACWSECGWDTDMVPGGLPNVVLARRESHKDEGDECERADMV